MPETRIYDKNEAREKMHTEVHTNVSMPGEGELIAVVRGVLENRTVDKKFRVRNNMLEVIYNFYYKGELFESGEWSPVGGSCHLSEDGKKVISGETPSDRSETSVDKWVNGEPVRNMIDDITIHWGEIREEVLTDS